MSETPDQLHARLLREQQTVHRLNETAQAYETKATAWDAQIAREDRQLASGELLIDPDVYGAGRADLQARAAQHREWATERRERADAMQESLLAEWKANPDLRPDWAPKPSMAEELQAHQARAELRERAARSEGRDQEHGRDRTRER